MTVFFFSLIANILVLNSISSVDFPRLPFATEGLRNVHICYVLRREHAFSTFKFLPRTRVAISFDYLFFVAPPDSPTIVDVETSVSKAVVMWKFGDDGGMELISLTLQYKEVPETEWQEIQIKPPDRDKYTITDLVPNTNYGFRILATNILGSSPPSSIFVTKTGKPGM